MKKIQQKHQPQNGAPPSSSTNQSAQQRLREQHTQGTPLRTPHPPPIKTHRLRANRQRDSARRRQQTSVQLADHRQRHATRRQQETTQAREARCVCIRPRLCVSVCVYVLCALVGCKKLLVAKEFSPCDCLPPDLTNGPHTSTVNAF